jgi:hypothetical protein
MIRTHAVNCTVIHVWNKDDRKTVAQSSSDRMVMGLLCVLCEVSLNVSQQNHFNISGNILANTLKQFYMKKGIF